MSTRLLAQIHLNTHECLRVRLSSCIRFYSFPPIRAFVWHTWPKFGFTSLLPWSWRVTVFKNASAPYSFTILSMRFCTSPILGNPRCYRKQVRDASEICLWKFSLLTRPIPYRSRSGKESLHLLHRGCDRDSSTWNYFWASEAYVSDISR